MKNRKQTQGRKKTTNSFSSKSGGGKKNQTGKLAFRKKEGDFWGRKKNNKGASDNRISDEGKERFRTPTAEKVKQRLATKKTPKREFSADAENDRRKKNSREEKVSGKKTHGKNNHSKKSYQKPYESDREEKALGKKTYGKNSFTKKGYQKSYEKKRKESPEQAESFDGQIRLNRYLSNAGVCSRREADSLIAAGLVSVNGNIITELGTKVKSGDEVRFNNTRLSTERKAYIIMNKPKDTITSLEDPDKRRIVTDLLIGHDLPRVYPVGRLDRNTTGVLILTNDGELSQRLMHPKYGVQKVYKATLNKKFKGEDLWKLANGIELEDGFMKPDAVLMPDPAQKNEVVVELHSGKNRIVHRLFEAIGYSLDKLDRVVYAGFNKKGMKRGEWRELSDRELSQLKKQVKL